MLDVMLSTLLAQVDPREWIRVSWQLDDILSCFQEFEPLFTQGAPFASVDSRLLINQLVP
eukprot:5513482-Prymnesium_polylepis.1